mmetsp:Transcript_3735/g.9441  ORF Transcript_3735/g.9441 Transcript_3735/m.9441 type:complete len:215 (-) Transcript_3735:1485-2129(-)
MLGIPEQHIRILLEKHRVVHVRVPRAHRPLHNHHVLGLPHLDHRHPRDRRRRVLLRRAVDRVIGPDHEDEVRGRELLVDFVHFVDDVVRDAGLGEEHVELPGHAAGDGVDRELHVDALFGEGFDDVRDRVLCLGHRKPVARDNDDLAGRHQSFADLVHGGLLVDALLLGPGVNGLDGLAVPAEEHVGDRTVHGFAHDPGENRAGRADQGADSRQ